MRVVSWVKIGYTPEGQNASMTRCFYFWGLRSVALQNFDLLNSSAVSYSLRTDDAAVEEAERVRKGEPVEGVSSVQRFPQDKRDITRLIDVLSDSGKSAPEQYQAMRPLIDRRGIHG
ncbi:Uncharacterised protein [uncultured archaeon]|nr:Uncharacterised protein [uncultured archaeon]